MAKKELSFVDHLEELRWHIIRVIIAVLVFTIAAFLAKDLVFHVFLLGPSRPDFWTYEMLCKLGDWMSAPSFCTESLNFTLQSRKVTGQFMMHLTSSFVVGLIAAFPYVFWELWRFVKPALYSKEKRVTRGATFFVSLLFISGATFGYFILAPISIQFLSNYQVDASIVNEFDIISYISTLCTLILGCALMFQLPMVVYVLAKVGLVSTMSMRKYRKHSIVAILIISAIITPADVFSQILVAFPLLFLYEISIMMVRYIEKKEVIRAKIEQADRKGQDSLRTNA